MHSPQTSDKQLATFGFVSKYLRAIAEPMELRAMSVFGLEQLKVAVSRLKLAASPKITPNARTIHVRHLFICELTKEDAIDADSDFTDLHRYQNRGSYWYSSEGAEAAAAYDRTEREFWELATLLVRSTSTNLQTLFISTFENWYTRRFSLKFTPGLLMPCLPGSSICA